MELSTAKTFYIKIKDYFNEEWFQELYNYFISTWLSIDENSNSRFALIFDFIVTNLNLVTQGNI